MVTTLQRASIATHKRFCGVLQLQGSLVRIFCIDTYRDLPEATSITNTHAKRVHSRAYRCWGAREGDGSLFRESERARCVLAFSMSSAKRELAQSGVDLL